MAPISTPDIPADWLVDWDKTTTTASPAPWSPVDVPIAAWVCIGLGLYGIVIALILVIRQCALSRGLCGECRINCCDGSCNRWCLDTCRASCDCRRPTLTDCLTSVGCPRKNLNFADIVMCQCCIESCDCCDEGCDCGDCNCNTNCDCDNINCLCFECKMNSGSAQ